WCCRVPSLLASPPAPTGHYTLSLHDALPILLRRGFITRHGGKLIIENLLTGIKKLIIKYSNCLKYNKQSYRPDHKCAQYKNNSMHRIGTLSVYLGFAIQLIHYQGDLRYRNGR